MAKKDVLNIGIDLRSLLGDKPSGVRTYTYNLLHEIFKADKKNQYVLFLNCFRKCKIPEFKYKNVKLVHTKIPNKLFNISTKLFKFPKIDLIIKKQLGIDLDVFFMPDLRIGATTCPKIITFHDLSFEKYSHFFNLKTRLRFKFLLNPMDIARRVDQVIAVSNFTKDELEQVYKVDDSKIEVVSQGVSENVMHVDDEDILMGVRAKYKLPEKYIFTLSAIEPRKNLDVLIKAFNHVKRDERFLDYKLVIGGPTDSSIFRKTKIEESEDVILLGEIPEGDKSSLITLCECFAYVSLYEGFGLPVLEAMKVGVPLVTSNIPPIRDLVEEDAYLVEPHDVLSVADGIKLALDSSDTADRVTRAYEKAKEYTWSKCALDTLEVIKKLINK